MHETKSPNANLDNLHVAPQVKRKGIGRQMMIHVATELATKGKTSLYLWVLDGNLPAIRFYQKMHGLPDAKGFSEIAGHKIPKTRYVWHDLDVLLKS